MRLRLSQSRPVNPRHAAKHFASQQEHPWCLRACLMDEMPAAIAPKHTVAGAAFTT